MDGNLVWKIIGWQGSGALCVCVCVFIYLLISILHLFPWTVYLTLKLFLNVSHCNMSLGLVIFQNVCDRVITECGVL